MAHDLSSRKPTNPAFVQGTVLGQFIHISQETTSVTGLNQKGAPRSETANLRNSLKGFVNLRSRN